jgi:hypothetical protein
MIIRLQNLDDRTSALSRHLLYIQRSPADQWSCASIRGWSLCSRLERAGLEDIRDWAMLQQRARAARRHLKWTGTPAYAEYDSEGGINWCSGSICPSAVDP